MNQCDGCRRGLPLFPTLSGGEIHKGDGRWDLILCTKHLYENLKPPPEVQKTIPYWPYCETCHVPFEFEPDEPFAHCKCGCTEWGYPRPADYVQKPVCRHTWIDGRDTSWSGKDFCCKCGVDKPE